MRQDEIVGLRWADLNETDRTILNRNRKDPQEKLGNHQTVPLLVSYLRLFRQTHRHRHELTAVF